MFTHVDAQIFLFIVDLGAVFFKMAGGTVLMATDSIESVLEIGCS
jgi:hypothetical protein